MVQSCQPSRSGFLLTAFLMGTCFCHGADTTPNPGGMGSSQEMMEAWLKMFGALVTVLALFFMGVLLFRKYGGFLQNRVAKGHLKVLESRMLNQKNALYVVEYKGEQFLITTGSQGTPGITLLNGMAEGSFNQATPASNVEPSQFGEEIRKAMHEPS